MINEYFIFITLAIAVTSMPGPVVILTIRNSIKSGYRGAVANIAGNFTAMVIMASISAAGVGAIIMSSTALFAALKVIGCLYLVYIGITQWKRLPANEAQPPQLSRSENTFFVLFKEGFIVGISNPKAIAFFTALFPQFIDPTREIIPQFLILIFTIEGISFLILSSYAVIARFASPYLLRGKTVTLFNKSCGAALVGFGIALIYYDGPIP